MLDFGSSLLQEIRVGRIMNSGTLNNWVQTITGLAIVLGLALVIWELQQNREATQSQLTTEGWHLINQTNTALLGESPADVLAKACDTPDALTTADFIILDYYFSEIINHRIFRLRSLARRGSFYADDYWKTAKIDQWYWIFSSPAGRAWWRTGVFSGNTELRAFGDDVLRNWTAKPCVDPQWKSFVLEETSRTRQPN